jgi:alkylation response protein AidB-like acyl-CoA dehydrogenase
MVDVSDVSDVSADSAGIDAFRQAVRAFVAEHAPPLRQEGVRVPRDADEERRFRTWLAALYDAGYLGAGWPAEWGGRPDHHPMHDLVLMEELIRARAYRPIDQVMLASHAILEHGTEAQKHELLSRIRGGEHIWCQLFSEPDAGSDLASLRTRAEADGDGFVVTGQKIWSTDAQWADMGMLLARTDPSVDRHAGLTAFAVPMGLPGIEVRPIREITGMAEFCEVFLDGLRLGPEHVLGDVNGGWKVVTSGLASERAFVGANALQLEMMFADLVRLAGAARLGDGSAAIDHEDVQRDLAQALAKVEEVKLIVRDTVERILVDEEHPSDGPVAKLAYTEMNVELCEQAMRLIASSVSTDETDEAPDESAGSVEERWRHDYLWSRSLTIAGGSSEILRGLVGRQLLGLPRA